MDFAAKVANPLILEEEEQLAKLINVGHLHISPFLWSPLVLGNWFSVLEEERGEQLLPPGPVRSKGGSVEQNSSTKYPNRLTSSGASKSQLLLLKVLCIEYKQVCVSGNKVSLFRFPLYIYYMQQDDASEA